MSAVRAATTLALWAAAHRAGQSADELLAAVDETGFRAGVRASDADVAAVTGLPGPGEPSAGSMALLPLIALGGEPELLLPAAGDVRGLPPGGRIAVPALDAGAVVVLPGAGLGLVPIDGQWRAYRCTGSHPAPTLLQAHDLVDEAVADATRRLVRADFARGNQRVHDRLRELMIAEAVHCPPGTPPQASALLAKAISLQALLEVAAGHGTAAVSMGELALVDDALRPLTRAVREARRAVVFRTVQVLLAGVTGRRADQAGRASRW